MLSPSNAWVSLGLALILCSQGSFGDFHQSPNVNVTEIETETTVIYDPSCSTDVTIIDKTTILSPTTVPVTYYVSVPVTHYVDVTYYVNITSTSTSVECITESTTTTLHYTVSTTETDLETVSITETDLETISITKTDLETITNTETDSETITNTETTYTTTTIFSTTYDPCPTTCSISAGTVNLYFWPTDRPYSYPTTYVDTNIGYTFVSPSVYMYIPTAVGTNSLGRVGPETSKWMLPLDLYEVSTIVDGSITRQLTLSDIGTDCAQTADPTAIATMVDSRCDPILAAPKQVSSWAYPCNACGRFGLFDPPYAIPTVTGGLIEPTTTAAPAPTTIITAAPTATPEIGILLIVYYSDGTPVATATVTTTGSSGTQTSSVEVSATSTAAAVTSTEVSSTEAESSSAELSSSSPTTTPVATFSAPTTAAPTTSVVTASAAKMTSGFACLISSIFIALYLI